MKIVKLTSRGNNQKKRARLPTVISATNPKTLELDIPSQVGRLRTLKVNTISQSNNSEVSK